MIQYFVFGPLSIVCYQVQYSKEDFSRTNKVLNPDTGVTVHLFWCVHMNTGDGHAHIQFTQDLI